MQIELLNDQGQASATYDAPETVFGRKYNEDLVHQIVVAYQANAVKARAPRRIVNRFITRPRSHSSKRELAALAPV